jgi:hypothetical protein
MAGQCGSRTSISANVCTILNSLMQANNFKYPLLQGVRWECSKWEQILQRRMSDYCYELWLT